MANPIRVVVIEDQELVRAGLCSLLVQHKGIAVCGSVSSGREAVKIVQETKPDVVVADYFLDGRHDGSTLISELVSLKDFPVRILILSLHDEDTLGERALRAGARGYLCKDKSPQHLIEAVKKVAAGGYYVSDVLLSLVSDGLTGNSPVPSGLARLSERELQILRLIGSGEGLEAIGTRLGISPRTVASHRETIKRKLDINDSAVLRERAQNWVVRGNKALGR